MGSGTRSLRSATFKPEDILTSAGAGRTAQSPHDVGLRASTVNLCSWWLGVVESPNDQGNLHRQPKPLNPWFTHPSGEWNVSDGHINIGREHSHEQ